MPRFWLGGAYMTFITPSPSPKNGYLLIVMLMTRATLLALYIFKGERMWENYIKLCKMGNMHGHVKKNLDNCIPLQGMTFFNKFMMEGISQ
jgi:hypothetical protein